MPHLLALFIVESVGEVYGMVEERRLCGSGGNNRHLAGQSRTCSSLVDMPTVSRSRRSIFIFGFPLLLPLSPLETIFVM